MRSEQQEREYKHKQQLIDQAKAEFARSKKPAAEKKESTGGGRRFFPWDDYGISMTDNA